MVTLRMISGSDLIKLTAEAVGTSCEKACDFWACCESGNRSEV